MSNIKKIIFPWFLGSGETYSTEYQAILTWAAANGATAPSNIWDRQQEDLFIQTLISSGAWALTDQIFNFGTVGDRAFSLINLKAPGTRNATISVTGTTLFEKGSGLTNDGAASYIKTNFNPTSHGVNYTQNNASILYRTKVNYGNRSDYSVSALGAVPAGGILLQIRSSDLVVIRSQQSTNSFTANTLTAGNWVMSRSGASLTKLFKNGSQVGSNFTVATNGLVNEQIYLNVLINNSVLSSYADKQVGFYLIGSNVDAIVIALNTAIETYFTTLKTITQNSFTNKTSISNYLSDINLSSVGDYNDLSEALVGSTLSPIHYQAASYADNGYVYFGPGNSTKLLKLNTADDTTTQFGTLTGDGFKYGGVIEAGDWIYYLPANATVVMKVKKTDDTIVWFDTSGVKVTESGNLTGAGKWYGWFKGADGKLYGLPFNATSVLIVDPATDAIQFLDTTGIIGSISGNLSGSDKWDTGCLYGQYIYGTPSNATDFLKVDTQNQTCTRFGTVKFGAVKWSLTSLSKEGYIYMYPYYDNQILKFNPQDDTHVTLPDTFGAVGGPAFKFGAAQLMPDKTILMMCGNTGLSHYIHNTADDTFTALPNETNAGIVGGALAANGAYYGATVLASKIVKFYYPRRTITLSDNFVRSNFIHGF